MTKREHNFDWARNVSRLRKLRFLVTQRDILQERKFFVACFNKLHDTALIGIKAQWRGVKGKLDY